MTKNCETCAHEDCEYWESPCRECIESDGADFVNWEACEEAENVLEEANA